MNKVYLGINVSHGASAALMVNGIILVAAQEERFTKIKNFTGYPKKSIGFCLSYARKNRLLIDEAAFSTINNVIFQFKYPFDHFYNINDWFNHYGAEFYAKKIKKNL